MTDLFDERTEALEALAAGENGHAVPDWSLELPASRDEERAVLGAMLLGGADAGKLAAALEPEDFSEGRYAALFKTLRERLASGKPTDGVSLVAAGVIDQAEFAAFVDVAVNAGTWQAHAASLRDFRTRRRLIWTARRMIGAAYKDGCDVPALLSASLDELDNAQRAGKAPGTSPETLLDDYERMVRAKSGLPLLKSGIYDLDKAIGGGVPPGKVLGIVGGEGSMKTSLALKFLSEYLKTGTRPALYLSLDMRPEDIAIRRLLPEADAGERSLIKSIVEHPQDFAQIRARLAAKDAGRVHIADGPLRLADIEALVSRLLPGIVIWDYITATDGYHSEMEAQRACVAALRNWQHRYDVTWIVLSQMSELAKLGQRQGDFAGRASGGNNLARVAHVQLELYREDVEPEKYQMIQGIIPKSKLICTVTKGRWGGGGSCWELDYDGPTMSFTGRAERVKRKKNKKPLFEAAGVIV